MVQQLRVNNKLQEINDDLCRCVDQLFIYIDLERSMIRFISRMLIRWNSFWPTQELKVCKNKIYQKQPTACLHFSCELKLGAICKLFFPHVLGDRKKKRNHLKLGYKSYSGNPTTNAIGIFFFSPKVDLFVFLQQLLLLALFR